MNIAELKGEKTVKTLAKRLLAEPSKGTPKTTQAEMEAALIRLNPHLSQIGELEKGTPIVVPGGFGLAPEQSTTPTRGLAEELLQRAESALDALRETIKEQATRSAAESDRAQTWLKSEQAKELVKQSPELKEVFSGAASAVKTIPKERSAAIAAEGKALDRIQVQLANFRNARSG
jgi:hypothetical protein